MTETETVVVVRRRIDHPAAVTASRSVDVPLMPLVLARGAFGLCTSWSAPRRL
jgi:hypothetical protein